MKILFIRYKKSKNILEGGEQGSQKNYNVLSSIVGEENVETYYVHDESHKPRITVYVGELCYFFKNYYYGLSPKRVREIVEKAKSFDLVFVDRSIFGIIAKRLKECDYKGRVVCFFHNVELDYFKAKMKGWNPAKSLILHCVDKNDGYSCKYADKIITLNPRDSKRIKTLYNRDSDVMIPVAFADRYNRESYPSEMTRSKLQLLFLGAYFGPNNEGIEWFFNEVYPHVNVEVKIVGKGMDQLRANYKIPEEVEVVNDAPDLEPYFENADMMVLPIFKGSGMKVKTCESLMYGKNIVATDEALVGYDLDYKKMGGCCNTAKEFIDVINEISANPRPRFNNYCRQVFLDKYTEKAVEKLFRQVLY